MADREITWRDKLRYRFENTLSKGTIAIIGWLALSPPASSLARSSSRHARGPGPGRPRTSLRLLRRHVAEHAAHAGSGRGRGRQRWQLRLLMMIVTIGGIFIVSILIGTITSGLEARLANCARAARV
jgi:hypothetical protein